jgi:clan AA aspartic protease
MKYSLDYNPPAPSLTVRFSSPTSTHSIEIQAKIDTGADITVLPQHAISKLRLIPAGRLTVISFDGREERKYTYFVNLQFNNFKFQMVEVISAKRQDALLGRDILNQLKTTLDGKTMNFELLDP